MVVWTLEKKISVKHVEILVALWVAGCDLKKRNEQIDIKIQILFQQWGIQLYKYSTGMIMLKLKTKAEECKSNEDEIM